MNLKKVKALALALGMFVCVGKLQAQGTYTINQVSSTDTVGTLYDQGGPTGDYYPVDPAGNISFSIIPSDGKVVKARFFDFDIEAGVNSVCIYDHVTLYDGPDTLSPPIGIYCGSALPPDVETSGNGLTVQLFSDQNSTGRGFDMRWSTGELPPLVPTGTSTGYCTPKGFNCDTVFGPVDDDDFIEIVQLSDLNSVTTCSANGYSDYTYKVANVTPGTNVQLNVNLGGPGSIPSFVYAWIDWNKDSVFADDEAITMVGETAAEFFGDVPYTGLIQVPTDSLGMVRMRIKVNGAENPCDAGGTGEIEDYHINVGGVANPGYCTASGFKCNGADTDRSIINVLAANVNNPSSCSNNGYSDFSNLLIELVAGGQTDIVVTTNDFVNSFTMLYGWVDWNQDMTFSQDEAIVFAGNPQVSPDFTGAIVPPLDALPGKTRMRLRYNFSANNISPCGPDDLGEVEDYSVLVGGRTPCTTYIGPDGVTDICTQNNILTWNSVAGATDYELYVKYDKGGSTTIVADNILLQDTTFVVANELENGATYTWVVHPVIDGNKAFDCDTASFTTAAEKAPVLSAPQYVFTACSSTDVNIETDVAEGKQPFTWTWTGDIADLNRTDTGDVVFNSTTIDDFVLYVSLADANGCTSDTIPFEVSVTANADAGVMVMSQSGYCFGEIPALTWDAAFAEQKIEISLDGVAYSEATTNQSGNEYSIEGLSSGNYFVRGVLKSGDNCADTTDVVQFEVFAPLAKPIISFVGGISEVCQGDTTYVQIENYSTGIAWFNDPSQSQNPYEAFKAIEYYAVVTDVVTGCAVASDTVMLTVEAIPAKPTITFDATYLIASENAVSYIWMLDGVVINGESNDSLAHNKVEGKYTVKAVSGLGCESDPSDIYDLKNIGIAELAANGVKMLTKENQWILEAKDNQTMQVIVMTIQGQLLDEKEGRNIAIDKRGQMLIAKVTVAGQQFTVKLLD